MTKVQHTILDNVRKAHADPNERNLTATNVEEIHEGELKMNTLTVEIDYWTFALRHYY